MATASLAVVAAMLLCQGVLLPACARNSIGTVVATITVLRVASRTDPPRPRLQFAGAPKESRRFRARDFGCSFPRSHPRRAGSAFRGGRKEPASTRRCQACRTRPGASSDARKVFAKIHQLHLVGVSPSTPGKQAVFRRAPSTVDVSSSISATRQGEVRLKCKPAAVPAPAAGGSRARAREPQRNPGCR